VSKSQKREHSPDRSSGFRRQLLAKIHIARKQLALDEGTYRALLTRITGADSAADIAAPQLMAVVEEFKRLGWKDAPAKIRRAGSRPLAPGAEAAKARALWLNLWHLGVIADPAEARLDGFCKRMTGRDSLRFLDQVQMDRLIRALRGWLERVGFTEPDAERLLDINAVRAAIGMAEVDHGQACKIVLIARCWERLIEIGAMRTGENARLGSWLMTHAGVQSPHHIPAEKLDRLVERIGAWLRAELAKRGGQEAVPAPEDSAGPEAGA